MNPQTLITASTWIIPVILAVTLHEAAHGWVAERFGDNTARRMGRVTFNPFKHVDPMGTILIPGLLLLSNAPFLFGYAKPVPVDFSRLQPGRLGMLSVAIAGPLTNIFLAITSAILLHFGSTSGHANMSWWELNLYNSLLINCALAVFNMIPILPLDGGRVLRSLLTGEIGRKYANTERYGMVIVLSLIFLPQLIGLNFFINTLIFINMFLIKGILLLAGIA